MTNWHGLEKEEVLKKLNASLEGLSEKEAGRRLESYGENKLKEVYRVKPFKIFLKQFKSFLIYVLLFAIVISLAIQRYIDASVLIAIVLLNAFIGFFQQYKAEKSIIKLREMFIPTARVFRQGKLKIIKSTEVVPGDIIIFEQGDRIVADCRILEAENLEINEAILTGESNSVEKYDTIVLRDGIIAERLNMIYTGTSVTKGKVKAVVVYTGMSTEFGRIALKLQEINITETPMQKKLDKFAKQVTLIVLVLATLTFLLGIIQGRDLIEMLLTAIAISVSAIPEGLPAIITISLAFATNKMLKNNVLIRRLPAAETLGSVSVIATDKTGTLTQEKMSVVEIFSNDKLYKKTSKGIILKNKLITLETEKPLFDLIKTSILASNARFEEEDNKFQIIGDTTETALVALALDSGVDKKILTEIEPRIKEISFSSERKMMSILRKSFRRNILYCKGSPSSIIEKSSFEIKPEGVQKIEDIRKKALLIVAENLEKKGLRVLAFAFKYCPTNSDCQAEDGLTFLGFMALLDPPRPEVEEAIKLCKSSGISVKMITGDSMLTAKTVGEQIGITGKIIGGRELEEMSDEELESQINNIAIFARIEPKQKLRIAEILMKKGEEVAITGDGVNDILALKRADIGIAMGKRGSDIAREVSDMILIDDNFANIIKGIEEGRIVYDNTKKATKFLLASNMGELLIIAYSIILKTPLPILPLQILWINLVTDTIPAIALTKEKGEDVMKSKPRKEDSILKGIFWFIFAASIISLLSGLFIFHYGLVNNLPIEKIRTMVMFSLVGFETFFVFSCRSDKPLTKIGFFSNKYVIYAFFILLFAQLILIFTPLASLFSITKLSLLEWGLVLLASLPGIVIFEAWKLWKYRKK